MTVAGENFSVDYRTAGDGLYLPDGGAPYLPDGGAPYLGGAADWRPWPGRLTLTVREPIDVRISVAGGNVQGVISALAAQLDVDDVVEQLNDVAIAAGGTRLPITKSYRAIVAVQGVTLQDDGGDAVAVRRVDLDPINGPLMKALDDAGQPTTATIDAVVKGY